MPHVDTTEDRVAARSGGRLPPEAPRRRARCAGAGLALGLVALAGVWSLEPPVPAVAQPRAASGRYGVGPEDSEVRYRVREQLVGLSFLKDAAGATNAVEGAIAFDAQGRLVPGESRFMVDLRTLRSDESRRDNYVRRNTLETDR